MAGRGFRVTFRVEEIRQALDAIGAYDGRARARIEKAVQDSTKAIKEGAKRRVPVRTGDLRKHITSSFSSKYTSGIVRAKEPYAHLIEFPVKSHIITQPSGRVIHHPGFAGRPFMRPAFEDEKPNLIKNLEKAVRG